MFNVLSTASIMSHVSRTMETTDIHNGKKGQKRVREEKTQRQEHELYTGGTMKGMQCSRLRATVDELVLQTVT